MPDQPAVSALSRCLVEGDEAALRRARRLRRKTLLLAVALEAALVAAMLLAPLVATSERPRLRAYPLPPFRGTPQDSTQTQSRSEGSGPTRSQNHIIFDREWKQPNRPTASSDAISAEGSSSVPNLPQGACAGCVPDGIDSIGPLRPNHVGPPPAPAPMPVQERRKVSEGVQAALLINNVKLEYPIIALHSRLQGTVRLRAIIGTDGSIRELELVSGNPILAQAALAGVAQWRYRPTLLNNQPVEVETHITVVFELRR